MVKLGRRQVTSVGGDKRSENSAGHQKVGFHNQLNNILLFTTIFVRNIFLA